MINDLLQRQALSKKQGRLVYPLHGHDSVIEPIAVPREYRSQAASGRVERINRSSHSKAHCSTQAVGDTHAKAQSSQRREGNAFWNTNKH
jgi:hypothetical protein